MNTTELTPEEIQYLEKHYLGDDDEYDLSELLWRAIREGNCPRCEGSGMEDIRVHQYNADEPVTRRVSCIVCGGFQCRTIKTDRKTQDLAAWLRSNLPQAKI